MLQNKAWFIKYFLLAENYYVWVCIAPACYASVKVDMMTLADLLDRFPAEEHKYGFYDASTKTLFVGTGS